MSIPKANGESSKSRFRVAGAPAGSHPHMPWSHSVLYDPYERINFWSHFIPGLALFLVGISSYCGLIGAAAWEHNPLGIFCFCATITHLCSAITHVYPDSHSLEKLDHVAIVVLIVGTPVTQSMAAAHGAIPRDVVVVTALMAVAAACRPVLRVVGFVVGSIIWGTQHLELLTPSMLLQSALYIFGAASFLRNGGHGRIVGLQDHHILHYAVTLACSIHVWSLIRQAEET